MKWMEILDKTLKLNYFPKFIKVEENSKSLFEKTDLS